MSDVKYYKRLCDDIWEYCMWLQEVKRELRGADKHPEPSQNDESEDKDD